MHLFISFIDYYFNLIDKNSYIKFPIYSSTKYSRLICKSLLILAKSWSPEDSETYSAILFIYSFH
jgi:hypothetical protein